MKLPQGTMSYLMVADFNSFRKVVGRRRQAGRLQGRILAALAPQDCACGDFTSPIGPTAHFEFTFPSARIVMLPAADWVGGRSVRSAR